VPEGDRERVVGVEYVEVTYFERRQLRRHAGVGSLWALGVGAVISGDFFGWNFGLAAGGFSGLLVATGIITWMYAGLCFSIAEMSPALPHTGGAYSYWLGSEHPVGAVLLNLAVFGAVLSYVLQMLSFLLLRRRLPHIERPYRSPLGVAGAWMALVIAAVTLVALFWVDPVYQKVALGAAVWYAAGLLWFALIGRRNLVYSPEEDFAVRARRG
jgi:amino acid transporter